ncbi:MAG: BON domain-containing protein, partial [Reyranellales bacterium]
LAQLAELMETHKVKRIPIVRDGVMVGVVSRANLLQALLSREPRDEEVPTANEPLRRAVTDAVTKHGWSSAWPTNVVVNAGVVHLWGFVPSDAIRTAYRVAAENVPGVKGVKNHLRTVPASVNMGV